MEVLRGYFNKFIQLNDQEWQDFQQCLTKEVIRNKDLSLKENEKCDFIAFIQEGVFRFYSLKEGEEKITAFFFPGDFVSNYRSFLTGKPSGHHIEALPDAASYHALGQLYTNERR